jgi:hypothetical protein
MKLKKMLLVATSLSVGLTIAFFVTLHFASQKVIATLPEETVTCLPLQGIQLAAANPQLLATARYTTVDLDVDYFLYRLQKDPHEYVVTVDQAGRCERVTLSAQAALSAQIPLPIAKEFTLIKFRKAIAQIGQPALKRQIQQAIKASPEDTLSPEMRWAIDELGLS